MGLVGEKADVVDLIGLGEAETRVVGEGIDVVRVHRVATHVDGQIESPFHDGSEFSEVGHVQPALTRPVA